MVDKEFLSDWVIRAQKIAHLGIWDQNPRTDQLWWSDETFRILGLEPQSTAPSFEKFLQAVHPEDRHIIIEQTKLALESDDNPYKVEYRIILPDQSERILHEEALIERDEEGKPTKITGIIRDITERRQAEIERELLITQLQEALDNIKTLKGLLPICSHCKKIRDDKGYWNSIESYLHEHADAEFTHGICQDCADELYPELDIYSNK